MLSLLLTACETVISDCPLPVAYTQEDKQKAADELIAMDKSGEYPTIIRFMGDYKAERAQLRACFN